MVTNGETRREIEFMETVRHKAVEIANNTDRIAAALEKANELKDAELSIRQAELVVRRDELAIQQAKLDKLDEIIEALKWLKS